MDRALGFINDGTDLDLANLSVCTGSYCQQDSVEFQQDSVELVTNFSSFWSTQSSPLGRRTNMSGHPQQEAHKYLLQYCLPPVLLLGTVGNVLCVLVLQRKAMQTTPSSTYLICLAAADTLLLYVSAAKTWIRVVTGFELMHTSDAMCRLIKYIFFTCTHLSAWLVVLLSVERFIVVTLPFKAPGLVLVRRPRLVSGLLAMAVMLVNINVLWASQLKYNKEQTQCGVYGDTSWVCSALPIFNLLVYALVPSLLILFTNGAIIVLVLRRSLRCVQESRAAAQATTAGPPTDQSCYTTPQTLSTSSNATSAATATTLSSKTQRRLTCTLLAICVSWLVLSLPYSIMENVPSLGRKLLVRSLCYIFLYLNHSLNFYIYCLTGKKFRLELQRAFGCRPPHQSSRHKHHFHRTQQQQQQLLAKVDNKKPNTKDSPRAHLYN